MNMYICKCIYTYTDIMIIIYNLLGIYMNMYIFNCIYIRIQ